MRITNIGVFFFLLSVIFPLIFIPFSSSLRDYMAIKLLILFIGIFSETLRQIPQKPKIRFNYSDKLIAALIFWVFFSVVWGDYALETIGVQFIYLGIFLFSYVIARVSDLRNKRLEKTFIYVLVLEMVLHYFFIGLERGSINGAYLIGGVSSFFLFAFTKISYRQLFLSTVITAFFGGRRFVIVQLVGFFRKINKWAFLIFLALALLIINVITLQQFGQNIVIYQFFLGYRAFEYTMLFSNLSIVDLIFGSGLGTESFFYSYPSKGQVKHYGLFHNFYLTVIFNYGLIGFFILSNLIYITIKKNHGIILLFTIGWVVVAAIDSPKDGHWPLGALLGILNSNDNTNTA